MRKLIIDASNLRAGGGVVHLQNILRVIDPRIYGFQKVIVCGGRNPLENFPQKDWLDLREIAVLNRMLHHRIWWQQIELAKIAQSEGGLLFVPGGLYLGGYRPFVTMCQNLLPFSEHEIRRYGFSGRYMRMKLLAIGQTQTFCSAQGIIFLTDYVRQYLQEKINLLSEKNKIVIPHGSEKLLFRSLRKYSKIKNILYISTIDEYKHQIEVVKAVNLLRKQGFRDLKVWFVGGAYKPYLDKLYKTMKDLDPKQEFVFYLGNIPHKQVSNLHFQADLFVFASSCETFGISLLEAMAAAMPIACSDRGPMPEVLQDAGLYFDPEQPESIAACLKLLIQDETLCQTLGRKAHSLSQKYSWENCAQDTFSFLQSVYQCHFL